MITNYNTSISRLQQKVYRRGISYSLDTMKLAIIALDNPQKTLPTTIHIAGTNGKGSTLSFLSALLQHHGYRIGTYSSPHLTSYCERIQCNSTPISEQTFSDLFNKIAALPMYTSLTEFEILTLMALLHFNTVPLDYVIFETGLGGRLDATNILNAQAIILTPISYDHMDILGESLAQIATEKAGIITSNAPVISAPQYPEVHTIIQQTCEKYAAPLTVAPPEKDLSIGSLPASYHVQNASLALKALSLVTHRSLNMQDYSPILTNAMLPGRFQECSLDNRPVIFDGAHNEAGLSVLIDQCQRRYPNKQFTVVFGIHKNRSPALFIAYLSRLTPTLYYCDFDREQSLSFETIKEKSTHPIQPYSLHASIDTLPGDVIIVTGSLYFMAKFVDYLSLSPKTKGVMEHV